MKGVPCVCVCVCVHVYSEKLLWCIVLMQLSQW